jgi:hypothetical protein
MNLLDPFKFEYGGKQYDLHKIIGKEGIYEGEEFSKPIIIKGGIQKLCRHFGFADKDYDITWTDMQGTTVKVMTESGAWREQPLGLICTAIIYMKDKEGNQFVGDGEANAVNCRGLAAAHMQAMAIKRARSRAVLQELGIDAYGEEESQDFEKKAPYEKQLKTFLADSIINLASQMATPMEQDALRNEIREHFDLGSNDKFTFDKMNASGLLEFYGKLYHRCQTEQETTED